MLAEVPEFCHSSIDNESIDDDRLFIVSLLMVSRIKIQLKENSINIKYNNPLALASFKLGAK